MKTALIILSFLVITFIILYFVLGKLSRSGEAPGLVEGNLLRCPNKPNCVCSEYKDDPKHFIAPVSMLQNTSFDALPILKNTVRDMGGSVLSESDNYFASTFSSAVFGFVDDLEIRIDPNQEVIHIRSASRVGYRDRGVNKKRIELLKQLYEKKILEINQSLDKIPKSGQH